MRHEIERLEALNGSKRIDTLASKVASLKTENERLMLLLSRLRIKIDADGIDKGNRYWDETIEKHLKGGE